jgi:glutaminase
MSCRQLARAGRFLAHDGRDPQAGRCIVTPQRARQTNALMMLCRHYDNSGGFAFRVGLPAKPGVGGGILAVVPGEATMAVWALGLTSKGNSLFGALALERLATRTGWSVFEAQA